MGDHPQRSCRALTFSTVEADFAIVRPVSSRDTRGADVPLATWSVLRSRCRHAGLDPPQNFYKSDHVGACEYAFDAVAVEVGERRFVEQLRVHHTAREVVDNKVEEFKLMGCQPAALWEFG